MINAVIVDFDDTLCLTEEATFKLENEILRQMGRPPQSRQIHKATWGQPLFEAITLRSPGVDVKQFETLSTKILAKWVEDGHIDIIAQANLRALDKLLGMDKDLYVLTSRTHIELAHILEPDHELAKRVKAFYYRDIMTHHKPDPRAFTILLQEHDLTPERCVYVGDSPSDAAAANGAQIRFIASLESGIRTKADFSDYTVDAFIEHFSDLPATVSLLP